jgi:benzaldehyde dehydrogenase (NAD)
MMPDLVRQNRTGYVLAGNALYFSEYHEAPSRASPSATTAGKGQAPGGNCHECTGRKISHRRYLAHVVEPATGAKITSVGNATAADVRKAAAEARAAQPGWAATPYEERAAILRKAARVLEDNQEELIPWIARETGGIPAKAGFEIHMVTEGLYRASAMCTEPQGLVLPSNPGRISLARRIPRGVVGIISPFNFPLILSMRAVGPSLATGNTVVLKPDPRTVMTGGFNIARVFEEAGLPKGVLHVLPGGAEAGEALCTDPDIAMVSFTGSSHVGRRIGELAGKHLKKVQLELGGKNAVIVLEDADIDAAASAIAFGAWFHQGQICMTTGRILAQNKIVAALTEKLVAKANHLPVGDPLGQVALGPVINKAQVQRIDGIVKDSVAAGAKLEAGGTFDGPFYKHDRAHRRETRYARLRRGDFRTRRRHHLDRQR